MTNISVLLVLFFTLFITNVLSSDVNGRISMPHGSTEETNNIEVFLDGGMKKGFVKVDGTFTIHNVQSGSYVLEVLSAKYMFEPVRIDISSKGTVRARKLNNLKPSQVQLVRYPLELKPAMYAKYFQQREKFSIFDMLKNPMVLMMVLPLVLLLVMPKLVNTDDPELKKEMEQSMSMLNPAGQSQLPELSEIFARWGGGGTTKQSTKKIKKKS